MNTFNEIKGFYASSKSGCFSDYVEFKVSEQWHIAPVHAMKCPVFQEYAHWPLLTNDKTKREVLQVNDIQKARRPGEKYLIVKKTR